VLRIQKNLIDRCLKGFVTTFIGFSVRICVKAVINESAIIENKKSQFSSKLHHHFATKKKSTFKVSQIRTCLLAYNMRTRIKKMLFFIYMNSIIQQVLIALDIKPPT
jgi:hypothetical protein